MEPVVPAPDAERIPEATHPPLRIVPRRLDVNVILGPDGTRELDNHGEVYVLRRTSAGRLVLNK